MPCEMLVRATDNPPWLKGYPVVVKDVADLTEHPWGDKEGLPDFVIVEISNASKSQVDNYLEPLKNALSYEILVENAQGYRIKMSVNAYIAQQFGESKALRQALRDFIVVEFNGSVYDYDAVDFEWATFDIPKPFDLQDAKARVADLFEETVDVNRYYFASADVDTAINAGGKVTLTAAQAASKIIDKFA